MGQHESGDKDDDYEEEDGEGENGDSKQNDESNENENSIDKDEGEGSSIAPQPSSLQNQQSFGGTDNLPVVPLKKKRGRKPKNYLLLKQREQEDAAIM
jgi:hypothetical protein